jgi:excinuclease ABC subunit C
VVFQNGKPSKGDYKRYKVKTVEGQDDYDSMREIIWRRFRRYKTGDEGFSQLPIYCCLTAEKASCRQCWKLLRELESPCRSRHGQGMDKHRTRGLSDLTGNYALAPEPGILCWSERNQEEVHRYAHCLPPLPARKKGRFPQL